jgi:small subunit ribosomal protein S20
VTFREEFVARIKSAVKNIRKSRTRNVINRARRSQLRSSIRKMRSLLEAKDLQAVRKALRDTVSTIDRAVSKGVLHRNAAARHKSRLSRNIAALSRAK